MGFADARETCCVLFVVELSASKELIGTERIGEFENGGTLDADGNWHGHMAVTVGDYLFDPTAGQIKIAKFPQTIATKLRRLSFQGKPTVAALATKREDRYFELYWLEAPGSSVEYTPVQKQICSEIAAQLSLLQHRQQTGVI